MKKSRLLGAVCACLFTFFAPATAQASLIGTQAHLAHWFGTYGSQAVHGEDIVTVQAGDTDAVGLNWGWTAASYPEIFPTYYANIEDTYFTVDMSSCATYSIFNCTEWSGSQSPNGSSINGIHIDFLDFSQQGLHITNASTDMPDFGGTGNRLRYGSDWVELDFQGMNIRHTDFWTTTLTIESTVVPIPPAVWLFGSGLLGLVGIARRKKA